MGGIVTFRINLEDLSSNYFRLPPPATKYRLLIKGDLFDSLHTNYPASNEKFNRSKFNEIKAVQDFYDSHCELFIERCGVFEFYTVTNDVKSAMKSFVVDPKLLIPRSVSPNSSLEPGKGAQKVLLPIDAVQILTIIPKWMPHITKWPSFFRRFSETGYNMVHFAPVNTRGISNSPYAIYDQLSISDDLFDTKLTEAEKHSRLFEMINLIFKSFSIFSITDIVWNHTACNSAWLQDHPEAGYNVKNSPHLRPALKLDTALLDFSENLGRYNLPLTLTSEDDLASIIGEFMSSVFPELNLWQYYVIDVISSVNLFSSAWQLQAVEGQHDATWKSSIKEHASNLFKNSFFDPKNYLPFSKSMNIASSVTFMTQFSRKFGIASREQQIDAYKSLLDEINLEFYMEYDNDVSAIKDGLLNRARFLRLEHNGPKLGAISRE